jgi:hypothetical protein
MRQPENVVDGGFNGRLAIPTIEDSRLREINTLPRPKGVGIETTKDSKASSLLALEKIITSSANSKWEIGGLILAIFIPWREPKVSSFNNSLDKILDPG